MPLWGHNGKIIRPQIYYLIYIEGFMILDNFKSTWTKIFNNFSPSMIHMPWFPEVVSHYTSHKPSTLDKLI